MANTVAYPDLALKKIIGIDSSEDPTAFICLLEKITVSLGSRPAVNENNIQIVIDDRRKALSGSVLLGPAAEWFDSLEVALTWDKIQRSSMLNSLMGKSAVPIPNRSREFEKTARRKHKKLYSENKNTS